MFPHIHACQRNLTHYDAFYFAFYFNAFFPEQVCKFKFASSPEQKGFPREREHLEKESTPRVINRRVRNASPEQKTKDASKDASSEQVCFLRAQSKFAFSEQVCFLTKDAFPEQVCFLTKDASSEQVCFLRAQSKFSSSE